MSDSKEIDIRDLSKHQFARDADDINEEVIIAGCLQRIADAIEKMNKNFEFLLKQQQK